jgi:anti-sigma regulatory factor (Ser/Thr protein kinase)
MLTLKGVIRSDRQDINRLSEAIADHVPGAPREEAAAIKMACFELLDNVVKHGYFDAGSEAAFKIMIDESGKFYITTTNRIKSPSDRDSLVKRLKEIRDREATYLSAAGSMDELKGERGKNRKGLGLYRVAHEGRFKLGCKIDGDRLSVLAGREFTAGSKIEQFKTDELTIRVADSGKSVSMLWIGKSRLRNPGVVLFPYFQGIIGSLKGKSLACDFSNLDYMNSSTILSIMNFARMLNENRIQSVFSYKKSREWQVASFEAFGVVIRGMAYITLKAN